MNQPSATLYKLITTNSSYKKVINDTNDFYTSVRVASSNKTEFIIRLWRNKTAEVVCVTSAEHPYGLFAYKLKNGIELPLPYNRELINQKFHQFLYVTS